MAFEDIGSWAGNNQLFVIIYKKEEEPVKIYLQTEQVKEIIFLIEGYVRLLTGETVSKAVSMALDSVSKLQAQRDKFGEIRSRAVSRYAK